MAVEQRTERFEIRLQPSEAKALRELAARTGLSAADVVRQLIRREHAQPAAWPVLPPSKGARRA